MRNFSHFPKSQDLMRMRISWSSWGPFYKHCIHAMLVKIYMCTHRAGAADIWRLERIGAEFDEVRGGDSWLRLLPPLLGHLQPDIGGLNECTDCLGQIIEKSKELSDNLSIVLSKVEMLPQYYHSWITNTTFRQKFAGAAVSVELLDLAPTSSSPLLPIKSSTK